jgi:hypothetical protein
MQIDVGKRWGKCKKRWGNGGGNANRGGEMVEEMQIELGKRWGNANRGREMMGEMKIELGKRWGKCKYIWGNGGNANIVRQTVGEC